MEPGAAARGDLRAAGPRPAAARRRRGHRRQRRRGGGPELDARGRLAVARPAGERPATAAGGERGGVLRLASDGRRLALRVERRRRLLRPRRHPDPLVT
ncbi:hypothetical protein SBRY_40806 [Actinacidiphila bryophytorum]|uniref:Uncharacterized protein n=1 Tax=Actinacidiphila bryophytorum TaxID=1436133 RepID=A0A9W4MIU7_9ACTN|nr:hypothetical protein SBRY_40806 [Actinacidiphila bryophytorum]